MPLDEQSLDVVVVGAGLAGLACAARLRKAGALRFAVLEQGTDVGHFWRGNYDRIRLHSPFHDLPEDGGLRRRWGIFLARDELLAYLEAYAGLHGLYDHVRFGERVESVRRLDGGWEIRSSGGTLRARYAVIATAYNRKPVVPDLEGADAYRGQLLHSRCYRNATGHRGKRVLVVGSGNSAAEIALDLVDGGAASVALWVRAPRHVIALKKLGRMARVARMLRIELTPKHVARGHQYTRSHPEFAAQLAKKDGFFGTFGIDLSEYGIRKPDVGPATQMYRHGRVPWMDQGTADAIRAGRIQVIDGNRSAIEALTERGVHFSDRHEEYDGVVLATGFEPGLEDFLDDADRLLFWNADMRRRMPDTDGRSRSLAEPTLFFPGFDLTVNGGLSLGLWGFEVADAMLREC